MKKGYLKKLIICLMLSLSVICFASCTDGKDSHEDDSGILLPEIEF